MAINNISTCIHTESEYYARLYGILKGIIGSCADSFSIHYACNIFYKCKLNGGKFKEILQLTESNGKCSLYTKCKVFSLFGSISCIVESEKKDIQALLSRLLDQIFSSSSWLIRFKGLNSLCAVARITPFADLFAETFPAKVEADFAMFVSKEYSSKGSTKMFDEIGEDIINSVLLKKTTMKSDVIRNKLEMIMTFVKSSDEYRWLYEDLEALLLKFPS